MLEGQKIEIKKPTGFS